MEPESFPTWCKSVEDRFNKIEKKISRVEGEIAILIVLNLALLTAILAHVL